MEQRADPNGGPKAAIHSDLHRRSGSIPGEPYPPCKQIDCTAGAVSSKAKSIHSGKQQR
jgi:hypothetical protein